MNRRTCAVPIIALLCALITPVHPQCSAPAKIEVPPGEMAALEVTHPNISGDVLSGAGSVESMAFVPPPDSCSDSIATCKDPVKYLGTQNGCACFACEYATSTQHTVCTRNSADRNVLLKRSK